MNHIRSGLAMTVACLLAVAPLTVLTVDPRFAPTALVVVLVATLSALAARASHASQAITLLVQLFATLATLWWLGWITTSQESVLAWIQPTVTTAVWEFANHTAPLPTSTASTWLLLVLVGLLVLLIQLLARALNQPSWALAPLSVGLMVASTVGKDFSWPFVAGVVVAFIAIMGTSDPFPDTKGGEYLKTGRKVKAPGMGSLPLAGLLGIPVLALSIVIASFLPGNLGPGFRGGGNTGANVRFKDPQIDLNESLNDDENPVLLTYQSDRSTGTQLRLTSLSVMDDMGAHLAPFHMQGQLEALAASVPTRNEKVKVNIEDFASAYLPVPYAPTSISAPGEWEQDTDSFTIMARDRDDQATADLEYEVSSKVPAPTKDAILAANAGKPSDSEFTAEVPAELPEEIIDLSNEIVGDAETDGEKALLLQEWFRKSGGYTYDTKAPAGTGYAALTDFLVESKRGYCVHFATAMALMARIQGIPSRVAIGFTAGTERSDGSFEVKARNMHAWPELSFADLGWIAFEPTAAVAGAPQWQPASPSQSPSASPSATPSKSSKPEPSQSQTDPTQQGDTAGAGGPATWVLAGLLLLLLAGAPALSRAIIRRRRLGGAGTAEERLTRAWAEIHDTAVDLHMPWPAGSPRKVAAALTPELDEKAAARLSEFAIDVERAWFSTNPPDAGDPAADARQIAHALAIPRSTSCRFRARFLPASVWLRLRSKLAVTRGINSRRHDGSF